MAMCTDTTLCDKVCQWLATGRWFSPSTPVSSTKWNIVESGIKHHKPSTKPLNITQYIPELKKQEFELC